MTAWRSAKLDQSPPRHTHTNYIPCPQCISPHFSKCLAQADAQKFNYSINPLTLALRETKKIAIYFKGKTKEFVLWFCTLFKMREGSIDSSRSKQWREQYHPNPEHHCYTPCTLRLSQSRLHSGSRVSGDTTANTFVAGLGEGRKSSIRPAPHIPLLRWACALCSERPPTLVCVIHIGKRFPNS